MDLFDKDPAPPEDWTLDRAVITFLNRWIPSVLNAANRPTIEKELRELIADAKEHD